MAHVKSTREQCSFGQTGTNKYGDVEAEQAETDRWANVVEQTMVDLGVPAERIKGQGYGSRKLVVAPADPEAERLNIRIEFVQCVL